MNIFLDSGCAATLITRALELSKNTEKHENKWNRRNYFTTLVLAQNERPDHNLCANMPKLLKKQM
jgi:hypothetical protein